MISIKNKKKQNGNAIYNADVEEAIKGKTIKNISLGSTTIEMVFDDGSEFIFEVYSGVAPDMCNYLDSDARYYE